MKFTKIPETAFENIQLNAGMLVKSFVPTTGTATGQIGATSGGNTFEATPTFTDYGDDIDNCPKNTKELKRLDSWEVKMSGSLVSVTAETAERLLAAADLESSSGKITPRNDLKQSDFDDLWWVGDYSDKNGDTHGGFAAVHMMNALSTGGFKIKSGDKAKGTFDYEFTAHYSIADQDTVPFEVYIKAGTDEG